MQPEDAGDFTIEFVLHMAHVSRVSRWLNAVCPQRYLAACADHLAKDRLSKLRLIQSHEICEAVANVELTTCRDQQPEPGLHAMRREIHQELKAAIGRLKRIDRTHPIDALCDGKLYS